jgi:hypothetical protein
MINRQRNHNRHRDKPTNNPSFYQSILISSNKRQLSKAGQAIKVEAVLPVA